MQVTWSPLAGAVIFDCVWNKRAMWCSLIRSKKRICDKINRRRSLFFLFCFCHFLFVVLLLISVAFVVLSLKENKRATWRSLIHAKGRNL